MGENSQNLPAPLMLDEKILYQILNSQVDDGVRTRDDQIHNLGLYR